MNSQKPKQLELLATVRAIATLLIVLFHASGLYKLKLQQDFAFNFFAFGNSGVDIFFVLSGFFIFYTHKGVGSKTTYLREFIQKKIFRIYPYYWLITLTILPVYFVIPSFGRGHETEIITIIKSLLLIPEKASPILVVAWFLRNIIFLYLVFSIATILTSRTRALFLSTFLSLSLIVTAIRCIDSSFLESEYLIRFFLNYYNIEFFAGSFIAYTVLHFKYSAIVGPTCLLMGTTMLTYLGVSAVSLGSVGEDVSTSPSALLAYGISSVLIVLGAAVLDIEKARNIHNSNWFLPLGGFLFCIGAASYSIYLTHYAVLSVSIKMLTLLQVTNPLSSNLLMVAACLVALLVGYILHLGVETRLNSIINHSSKAVAS